MNKIELAIDAARNDDMERVIKLLEEVLAKQAEQEPVFYNPSPTCARHIEGVPVGTRITAPVRTKDLTDEELWEAAKTAKSNDLTDAFRAAITADRELNK